MYNLGVVLLSLCQGHSVTDLVVDLPTNLPRDFHDFLSMCLIRDERSRWSMQQLLDHSFVKTPISLTVTMATKDSGARVDLKQEGRVIVIIWHLVQKFFPGLVLFESKYIILVDK